MEEPVLEGGKGPSRMHVLMISLFYPPRTIGGAEKAASTLAESLVRSGNRVTVLSLHPGRKAVVEERNGVKVYRLPMDNLYFPTFGQGSRPNPLMRIAWHVWDMWNWKAARRVGRILDAERPDVVHTHGITGFSVAVWKAAYRRGIRTVHTMHDYYLLCAHSEYFRNGAVCERQCSTCHRMRGPAKKWSNKLGSIVSVSNFVLDLHRQHGYFEGVRSAVIPNIQTILPAPKQVPDPATRSGDTLVFGFIGRIIEAKGLQVLLAATSLMKQQSWRLRIAGDLQSPRAQQLKHAYPDPRIEWLGVVDSPSFYPSVDVVVIPSIWHDPLPYVVIESLMAGKAIISSGLGGIPELLSMGRKTATYPAQDPAELARLLDAAVSDANPWRNGGFVNEGDLQVFSEQSVKLKYLAEYCGPTRRNVVRARFEQEPLRVEEPRSELALPVVFQRAEVSTR